MAIRTELFDADVQKVATEWGLGKVESFRGLPEGSINTLYLLETSTGRQVLRLSEGRHEAELRFETGLVRRLESERFAALRLVPRLDGRSYGVLRERYACVFRWAAGEHLQPKTLSHEQALELGRVLGRFHLLTEGVDASLENRYSPAQIRAWVLELVAARKEATKADAELDAALPMLLAEAEALSALPPADEGVIHADFFPDNVKWVGGRVSAVLDFEMACRGPRVLDLAIALHAFSWDDGDFSPMRLRAIVEGYESERPLSQPERAALQAWARFAALRFTVTRIRDFHLSTLEGDKLVKKDWRRFRDRLEKVKALGTEGFREACGL